MKTILALTAMLGLSMGANAYFLNNAHNVALHLDECAKANNVYSCKVSFEPTEAPRVVTVQAALLPPPAL